MEKERIARLKSRFKEIDGGHLNSLAHKKVLENHKIKKREKFTLVLNVTTYLLYFIIVVHSLYNLNYENQLTPYNLGFLFTPILLLFFFHVFLFFLRKAKTKNEMNERLIQNVTSCVDFFLNKSLLNPKKNSNPNE